MREAWVQSLGREDVLEKAMATHYSILAWKISWTKEPVRLQSMRSQSQTGLSDFTFTYRHSKVLHNSALRHLSLLSTFLCNKLNHSLSDSQVFVLKY